MEKEIKAAQQRSKKLIYIGICSAAVFSILFIAYLILLPRIWAYLGANIARFRAVSAINTLPIPSGSEKVVTASNIRIRSNDCYMGRADALIGTNLSANEIELFYKKAFSNKEGFSTQSSVEADKLFIMVRSLEGAGDGLPVEGISMRKCVANRCYFYDFSEADINKALAKYNGLIEVESWYIPLEVRHNVCWCCDGV